MQCKGPWLNPWSGRTPPAAGHLSLCATSTELTLESPGAATAEARVPSSPGSMAREASTVRSPHTQVESSPRSGN